MHREVEEGYKWLPMFMKYHEYEGGKLDELMDTVDALWHKLEVMIPPLLGKQRTADDFRSIVKRLSQADIDLFCNTTDADLGVKINDALSSKVFKDIQKALRSRIP